MTARPAFAWFYLGTSMLALIVGVLIGVSSSPVVAVVVPLLFALLSAGGGLYIILGKDAEAEVTSRARVQRAAFMGKQLVSFALGVGLGLWCGVWAKVHGNDLWAASPESTIVGLSFSDTRALVGLLELDRRLQNAGVQHAERMRLLSQLNAAINARTDKAKAALADSDSEALEELLKNLPESKPSESGVPDFVATDPEIVQKQRNGRL
jgi:hypothetical protein